jgi:uncharacterized protein
VTNLFVVGAPIPSNPCVRHACTLCCHDTNMPLSLADIERLTSLGHSLAAFAESDEEEGYLRLHNTEEGACFFLDAAGRCSVQSSKPEGCRLYPFIFDEEDDRVIRDEICPFNREFDPPPEVESKVRELVSRLTREAAARRAHPGRQAAPR